jgi:hypothetical protein
MAVAHRRSWPRWPRRTARIRLTALYGVLFLLFGGVLVAMTYVLFEGATAFRTPPIPKVPNAPAIEKLQLPAPLAGTLPQELFQAQQQLAQAQKGLSVVPSGPYSGPIVTRDQQLIKAEHQLTKDQHQLAQTVHQLSQSVHQLSQAGTAQAAQRAADSHQLLVNSGIALAIAAVLALLAGWLVAGRMLRPIRTITRTARRISSTSCTSASPSTAPKTSSRNSGTPSMISSRGSKPLSRPSGLRRQRLPRAAHPPDCRANSPASRARRPRHDDRRMAFHRQ